MKSPRGSLMLEALVAVGIGGLFASALFGYVLLANSSTSRSSGNAFALWSAQEGLAALETLAFDDLTNTVNGALTFSANQWSVTPTGPESLSGTATRTVLIEDVLRDGDCVIVESGGTVDPDSKKLTSTVSWTDVQEHSHNTSLTTVRTNWQNPSGPCFAGEQVSQVDFDISGAVFSGGKQLREVYFTNNGTSDVTIDTIMFTWTSEAELTQVFMATSKVWSESGPGTPSDDAHSGDLLDIQDFVISPGTTIELNKGQFDENMSGVGLTMTVTFTDGSSYTSPLFYPL